MIFSRLVTTWFFTIGQQSGPTFYTLPILYVQRRNVILVGSTEENMCRDCDTNHSPSTLRLEDADDRKFPRKSAYCLKTFQVDRHNRHDDKTIVSFLKNKRNYLNSCYRTYWG
jgi:hypothetical protein